MCKIGRKSTEWWEQSEITTTNEPRDNDDNARNNMQIEEVVEGE